MSVTNFRSFKEPVEFDMTPSRERLSRALHVNQSPLANVLRLGLVYGSNSSGKSNLLKAVEFAKSLVTQGTPVKKQLNCPKFKLQKECLTSPSKFEFKFLFKDVLYSYAFELGDDEILTEELRARRGKQREQSLFSRFSGGGDEHEFSFGGFTKDLEKEERQRLQFIGLGTRPNQLFLYESVERNVSYFRDAFDWFDRCVRIFTPQSISHGVEFRIGIDEDFKEFLQENLKYFDPDVVSIVTKRDPASEIPELSPRFLSEIEDQLDDEKAIQVVIPQSGRRFLLSMGEDGEVEALHLRAQHRCSSDGELIAFDLEDESDGTRRFLELAPLIYELSRPEECIVAFIDELDRSFHSGLTQMLLQNFLANQEARHCQVVATSHDDSLMENDLFKRRDVLWRLRKEKGASRLHSLREYNLRHDKDIRKGLRNGEYDQPPS
ncbi:MAG: ATP/GTP-binding protein [Halioglobus sp.]